MLYHLFEWFKDQNIKFPGSGILDFISFRVLLAMLLSLIITLVFGKRLINVIKRRLGDETVRDLGLVGEQQKKGTPTMGGVIIILGIVVPTLLFARLDTIYIILMLIATVWLGSIGFIDDYLKLRAKRLAHEQGIAYKKGDKDQKGMTGSVKNIMAKHILAIETDSGVYRPLGFGLAATAPGQVRANLQEIAKLLSGIRADRIAANGGGADIGPIVREGVIGASLDVDGTHYFDIHHTPADTLDKIDPQDLALCVATMAVMAYTVADMPNSLSDAAPAGR